MFPWHYNILAAFKKTSLDALCMHPSPSLQLRGEGGGVAGGLRLPHLALSNPSDQNTVAWAQYCNKIILFLCLLAYFINRVCFSIIFFVLITRASFGVSMDNSIRHQNY